MPMPNATANRTQKLEIQKPPPCGGFNACMSKVHLVGPGGSGEVVDAPAGNTLTSPS